MGGLTKELQARFADQIRSLFPDDVGYVSLFGRREVRVKRRWWRPAVSSVEDWESPRRPIRLERDSDGRGFHWCGDSPLVFAVPDGVSATEWQIHTAPVGGELVGAESFYFRAGGGDDVEISSFSCRVG